MSTIRRETVRDRMNAAHRRLKARIAGNCTLCASGSAENKASTALFFKDGPRRDRGPHDGRPYAELLCPPCTSAVLYLVATNMRPQPYEITFIGEETTQ